MHENNLPFINDGEPVKVTEISTAVSLGVILGVLAVTVLASLYSKAGKAQNAIGNARRHATSYLDSEYTKDAGERERIYGLLLSERDQIVALGPEVQAEGARRAGADGAVAEGPRQSRRRRRPWRGRAHRSFEAAAPALVTARQVREATQMLSMESSRAASNSASLSLMLSPSVRAREKLAMTPGFRASRATASARV